MITDAPKAVLPDVRDGVREERSIRATGSRRFVRLAGAIAFALVAGLGLVVVREFGALGDAREVIARLTATNASLSAELSEKSESLADAIEAKEGLAGENGRLDSVVTSCRDAAGLNRSFMGAVKDMFRAAYAGNMAAVKDATRRMAELGRQAESATSACLRQAKPQVTTV